MKTGHGVVGWKLYDVEGVLAGSDSCNVVEKCERDSGRPGNGESRAAAASAAAAQVTANSRLTSSMVFMMLV